VSTGPGLLACKDVNCPLAGLVVPTYNLDQVILMRPAHASSRPRRIAAMCSLTAVAVLAGCASMPSGPTVNVMPGPNKPFEVFVADDHLCRDWAHSRIGGPGSDDAGRRFAAATTTGVVIGAAAGALIGGSHQAAGVGAAIGGLGGASVGADQSQYTAHNAQRRYDIAYQQCMYAKGNQVPGVSGYVSNYRSPPAPVPPATPRPPAGIQPPPPVR
jgi:hypothetical protein